MTDKITFLPLGFSVEKAQKTQRLLSERIIEEDSLPDQPRFIAGVDVAYSDKLAISAVSVMDLETRKQIEFETAVCEAKIPYVPTLLAFREIPPAIACIRKLRIQPDVFLVDGHGIAHPYRCGFASHLGLIVGKPTVGVAKKRLIGEPAYIGKDTFLSHNGKIIASVIRAEEGRKPIYVSVGHLISLKTAVTIVKKCTLRGRMPEPLWQAHRAAMERREALEHLSDLQKTY